jgi:hypothetical protein
MGVRIAVGSSWESPIRVAQIGFLPIVAISLLMTLSCWQPSVDTALVFSPDTLPSAQLGVAYSSDIQVTQNRTPVGGVQVADGTLPTGLVCELVETKDIIRISGTPIEAGTYTFSLSVWCYGTNVNGQTGSKRYSITVQ